MHNPHGKKAKGGRMELSLESDINMLSINQSVSALATGKLKPDSEFDTLVVGTQTNLLAYNVFDNSDLFYKEVCLSSDAIFESVIVINGTLF